MTPDTQAPLASLDDFEDTITNLAAYLMVAHDKHPKQILNSRGGGPTETPPLPRLRLTQHRTAALLAYGVPATADELADAVEWFATPFPSTGGDLIDIAEMVKLEGLLNLRPDDPSVYPRLEQLANQRVGDEFELQHDNPDQNPAPIFDTLWALRLLLLAWDKNIQHNFITADDARYMLDKLLIRKPQDKDLALALRLIHDLDGELAPHQENYLQQLIDVTEAHGGLWGVSPVNWDRLKHVIEVMHQQSPEHMLTPELLGRQMKLFHTVLLSTCYVIENLAPLARDYPQLGPSIHTAMRLWWQQFQGSNAARSIQSLFDDEYRYLMLLCRTVVAANAYIGKPAGTLYWLGPLRQVAQQLNGDDWPQKQSIILALREWFKIRLEDYTRLKLGLSDAEVYRIWPYVSNPTDSGGNLLYDRSLVVKYGPIQELERERENYNRLPQRLKDKEYFVRVPEASYTDERGQTYIIMEDLHQYETLAECHERLLKPDKPRVFDLLAQFLLDVHDGDGETPKWATRNHVRDMYILPLIQHIDQITDIVQMPGVERQLSAEERARFDKEEEHINRLIGGIMQYQQQLGFPLACMHGDLHSRNIMIRMIEQENRPQGERDLDFKLIDVENLRIDGDAAHDLGQFLVDLGLLRTTLNADGRTPSRDLMSKIERLGEHLTARYMAFAESRQDPTFELRLSLAQARSSVRVAKSKAKLSRSSISRRDYNEARKALVDTLNLVESTAMHLNDVYKQMRRL